MERLSWIICGPNVITRILLRERRWQQSQRYEGYVLIEAEVAVK